MYSPVFYQLYLWRWEKIDYTHAYFVLPVSLWIIWLKRRHLKNAVAAGLSSQADYGALSILLLISGLVMFVFGWKQDYLLITTLSLVPLLCGLISYLYGTKVLKILSFPISYLLLLVPPPLGILDNITIPMRYWVSFTTEKILLLFNYPITRDGLLLSMSERGIYMGPACSGFRSLITVIALGLAYVYFLKGTWQKKLILVFSLVPLALLGNLIRVLAVCLVTFYFGEAAGHKFHNLSGFLIFAFLIAGLIGLEYLFLRRRKADDLETNE